MADQRRGRPRRPGTTAGDLADLGPVGLVLTRPSGMHGLEPFFGELIAGIEEVLCERGSSLLLQVVPDADAELAIHRRWRERGAVCGVLVINVGIQERRLAPLHQFGLPFVVIADDGTEGSGSAVLIDNCSAMRDAVRSFAAQGHRRLAQVAGPADFLHTHLRSDAFLTQVATLGLSARVVHGDYSEESGARATASLLADREPPTAIVYDNDVMAVAGVALAARREVPVPSRLSLLAWDDSVLCRMTSPPLSAMSQDAHALGVLAAQALLETVATGRPVVRRAPPPVLLVRGTTGAGPA